MRRFTDPNSLFLIFCGLITSLKTLNEYLVEGKASDPDHNVMNIGVIPAMSITAALAVELMLKYTFEIDHKRAYPIHKGKDGHDLKRMYDSQKQERQDMIDKYYRVRYQELKPHEVRLLVDLMPPDTGGTEDYQSAQDVVDNEANVFVRARYLAEMKEITPGVFCRYKVDTRPYHLWALALGASDTIDWRSTVRPNNIVVTTNQ